MKEELYEKSPVRIFDKATDGGLKPGEVALVTAPKGLGKTSVLVQFGMDKLLEGKQLVHVTFDLHSSNVISWYDGIFSELAKKKNISSPSSLKDEVVSKRTILNFSQDNFTLAKVVNTLVALKAGGIDVAGVVIDGVDLKKVTQDDMDTVVSYAKTSKVGIWMSATADSDSLKDSVPDFLVQAFDIVVHLSSKADGVQLSIVKLRDKDEQPVTLKLDSKTLLMCQR